MCNWFSNRNEYLTYIPDKENKIFLVLLHICKFSIPNSKFSLSYNTHVGWNRNWTIRVNAFKARRRLTCLQAIIQNR